MLMNLKRKDLGFEYNSYKQKVKYKNMNIARNTT